MPERESITCQSSKLILDFFRHDPNDFLSRLVTMDETWLCHDDPETKKQSMEWRHSGSPRPKNSECKIRFKSSRLDLFGIKMASSSLTIFQRAKSYQCGVLLISAGAIEGHLKKKRRGAGRSPRGLVLARQGPAHRALATQKKLAYLGFQCFDHPPYSPDLAPSDYHLFPGLKKQLQGGHFSSHAKVIAAAETWLDGKPSDFLSGLQKLEQRAKKCIELRGECVE